MRLISRMSRRLAGQGRVLVCPGREFSTSTALQTSWSPQPAPPRLPKEEQDIFEQLQRQSTGAFSTPREPDPVSATNEMDTSMKSQEQTTASTAATARLDEAMGHTASQQRRTPPKINQSPQSAQQPTTPEDAAHPNVHTGDGSELHPNIRRGAPPEFEGEVNPRTGEKGGPKNEPLRWGGESDWSYNGRVTDF